MSKVTPSLRHFARRLIRHETGGGESSRTQPQALFQVTEKLRLQLTTIMGAAGYQSLISRALALAITEAPWLREVQIQSDGSLEGLEQLQARLGRDTFLAGGVPLLAQLLGLLVAFIGSSLTARVLHEIWPKIPLKDLVLEN
jgi:hypothetical protein